MKKIAILDCAILEGSKLSGYGSVGLVVTKWLKPFLPDVSFDTIPIAKNCLFPRVEDFDGFIVPGSEKSIYDNLPWIIELRSFLKNIKKSKKPLFGICFGHQLMADTFGGMSGKSDMGYKVGVGRFSMKNNDFNAYIAHQDQVLKVPKEASVVGSADYCKNAIIEYNFPAFSCQFHPEYNHDFVSRIVAELEQETLNVDEVTRATESLKENKVQDHLFAQQAATFFKTAFGE